MFRQPKHVLLSLLVLAVLAFFGCKAVDRQANEPQASPFTWRDQPQDHLDLLYQGRPLLRYVYAYDTSTDQRRIETYKPFHHVFDPTGEVFITKGPGGLYSHHRGIFIGWMKLTHAGKRYDLWVMGHGESQVHEQFLERVTLSDRARCSKRIAWNTPDGTTLIEETRTVTVHAPTDRAYFTADYVIDLKAVNGDVSLDGDPEHAGFQFRPSNDLAEQAKDGRGRAQYTFYRDGIDPRIHKNLPWVALHYTLGGRRYHVQHMTHPDNPRPWIYSAYRDYGRFGSYFKQTIADGETLRLKYRIRVIEGDAPSREQLQAAYEAYVQP